MSDFEVPEADALEQHQAVDGNVEERVDRLGDEVPEADALEQAEAPRPAAVGVGVEERADRLGYEVPEADALEQAEPAADDADDRRE